MGIVVPAGEQYLQGQSPASEPGEPLGAWLGRGPIPDTRFRGGALVTAGLAPMLWGRH